jgi:hypothetical protein
MTYLTTVPFNRINESWPDISVSAWPIHNDIKHSLVSGLPNNKDTKYQASFYKKIAVDIVTETVYNYPYPYISEKTLRPIACKRLFIIVGAAGTLEILHNKGFRSFPEVFDESYDTIVDPVERWHVLEKVITNFVTKPIEEIRDIVKSQSDILEKNFINLKNLQTTELGHLNDKNL